MESIIMGIIVISIIVVLFVVSAVIIEYPATSIFAIGLAIIIGITARYLYKNHKIDREIKTKRSAEELAVNMSKKIANDDLTQNIANDICKTVSERLEYLLTKQSVDESKEYNVISVDVCVLKHMLKFSARGVFMDKENYYRFDKHRVRDLVGKTEMKALAYSVVNII